MNTKILSFVSFGGSFLVLIFLLLFVNNITIVSAVVVNCGDTITADTILESDVVCLGGHSGVYCDGDYAALLINTAGVTLDCNGHSITNTARGICAMGVRDVTTTIKNCRIIDIADVGIYLYQTRNVQIINSTIIGGGTGITLMAGGGASYYNNIIDTTINVTGDGVFFHTAGYNNLMNSNISAGNTAIVLMHGYANNIYNNRLTSNNNGLFLQSGAACGNYYSASGNNVYNNVINSPNPVFFNGPICGNSWNTAKTEGTNIVGGPYIGGNYWANSSNTGFSQTCTDTDEDKICDSQYSLEASGGNIDYLPLSVNPDSDGDSVVDTEDDCLLGAGIKQFNGCTAALFIKAANHTKVVVGKKETSVKLPLPGLVVEVYDKQCALNNLLTASWRDYDKIRQKCPVIVKKTTDSTGGAFLGVMHDKEYLIIGVLNGKTNPQLGTSTGKVEQGKIIEKKLQYLEVPSIAQMPPLNFLFEAIEDGNFFVFVVTLVVAFGLGYYLREILSPKKFMKFKKRR